MEPGVLMVVGKQYCDDKEREFTVQKTSHFFHDDGFGAYDNDTGELAFRVDNYSRGSSLNDELVLLDPEGASIVTLHRKWPSLHSRWEGFLGERSEGQKLLFSVRRSSIFSGEGASVFVEVHGGGIDGEGPPAAEYRVDGSFAARSCRVLYEAEDECEVVAEIKRKVDAWAGVVLGRDVFCLCLRARADAAFAMAIVVVLDRISGDSNDVCAGIDPDAVAALEQVEEAADAGQPQLLITS